MPDDEGTDEPGEEAPHPHPSDSSAQRRAEREVLHAASVRFRRELVPTDLTTPNGRTVKVDGVSGDRSVLVEVYVRQSALLSGNKRKVLTDALRLTWFRTFISPTPTVALCLSSHEAASSLVWDEQRRRWPSWAAEALHDLGVEVHVFPLADDGAVREAVEGQYR